MKTLGGGVAFILVALTAILGVSISSALVEQNRLLDEFARAARDEARAAGGALTRVDSIDKDARMMVDLVERSRGTRTLDVPTERRVWDSAFRALAEVVEHYRILGLVDADRSVEVLAVDPTETQSAVEALLPLLRQMGREVAERQRPVATPTRVGRRSFVAYAVPVRGDSAIVVISDSALFLRAVAWPPLPAARLFVTDPAGAVWVDCGTSGGCRAADENPGAKLIGAGGVPIAKLAPSAAERYGLGVVPAVLAAATIDRPAGRWVVAWMASSRALEMQEDSLVRRILLTAMAVAVVVVAVGTVLLRQQRKALALQSQLRDANAQAAASDLENQLVRAEKMVTVGVMAAEIAHEVGNPLAVIRGRAEQVLRAIGDGPRGEDVRVVIRHVDHITSTIRQLLDFSRPSPGPQHPVSLEVLVERVRELLSFRLEGASIRFVCDLHEDLPTLAADPDQLQQVLVNLIINAADASQPGGKIRIVAHPMTNAMVRIQVIDEGSGIAPEHMQAVFEPFFTTKQRGEGTGLGLPISASIVRKHSGQINLESAPGRGTTVTLSWPSAGGAAADG